MFTCWIHLWLVGIIMQQNDGIAYNYGTCATLLTGAYVTFLFVTFTNWYNSFTSTLLESSSIYFMLFTKLTSATCFERLVLT